MFVGKDCGERKSFVRGVLRRLLKHASLPTKSVRQTDLFDNLHRCKLFDLVLQFTLALLAPPTFIIFLRLLPPMFHQVPQAETHGFQTLL